MKLDIMAMGTGASTNTMGSTETDLATISAWSKQRTDSLMLKECLTSAQYVMWNELKRGLKRAHRAHTYKPSVEEPD